MSTWKRRLLQNARMNQMLSLGIADPDPETGLREAIEIPYKLREAHMHVVGRTRSGKSRFIADLIQQDIKNGHGVCVVDPEGSLYDLTINWLAQNPRVAKMRKHIHAVRFTDLATTFCYNPLHINSANEAYSVANTVGNAITRIYGGNSVTETPLFSHTLNVTLTLLAIRGLPLAAAPYFLMDSAFGKELRSKVCEDIPDDYYRELGLQMNRMSAREFRDTVASTGRRLHDFMQSPAIRRIFSTTKNTAQMLQMMDERHILLLNTSDQVDGHGGGIDANQLRTIGMMFVNNIFAAARHRNPEDDPVPFFMYIDEVQNYVSNDIEEILSRAAKRGLFLTLAHQYPDQLVAADEKILRAVISGALIKAAFRMDMTAAETFVDDLFADRIDFELVKEKLKTPHGTRQEITKLKSTNKSASKGQSKAESTSQSQTHAHGHANTESWSDSDSSSDSVVETITISSGSSLDSSGEPSGTNDGESSSSAIGHASTYATAHSLSIASSYVDGYGTGQGQSKSDSTSESEGSSTSEALKQVYEWFSTITYPLEEQRFKWKRELKEQPPRHGYLTVDGSSARGFTTRDAPDSLNIPSVKTKLLGRLSNDSPWMAPADSIPHVLASPEAIAVLGERTPAVIRQADEALKKAYDADNYFEPDEPS
jgi:hypothetical protein